MRIVSNSLIFSGALLSIYKDFFILARITNAIALQSGSIQKNLNIRDVITELLKAHTESFTELMEFEPEKLLPTVQYIAVKGKEVFGDEGLGEIIDLTKELEAGMKQVQMLPTKEELNNDVLEAKKENFLNDSLICVVETVDLVDYYNKAMRGERPVNDIQNFKDGLDSFRVCLESIQNYKNVKLPRLEASRKLKAAGNYVEKISQTKSKEFKSFSKTISKIKEFTLSAKKIWTTRQPSGIYNTIIRIEELLGILSDHEKEPKPNLCAGFPGEDDVEKVTSDVKSEWFQKNIARGKSTSELEKALAPYEKIGRELKKLKASYQEFHDIFIYQKDLVHRMSGKISDIEKYGGLNNAIPLLDDSGKIFEQSWIENIIEDDYLKGFDMMLGVIYQRDEIQNFCAELIETFEFDAINTTLNHFEGLKLPTNLGDIKKEIQKIPDYSTLEAFLNTFSKFATSQTDLYRYSSQRGSWNDRVFDATLKKIKDSGVMKNLENLNINGFKIVEFRELVQFLEDLRESNLQESNQKTAYFPDKDNYPKFGKFFEAYANMKNSTLKIENFIKKMGTIPSQIVVDFKNSLALSTQFGRGMKVYRDIAYAYSLRDQLLKSMEYSEEVNKAIQENNNHQHVAQFWKSTDTDRKKAFEELIENLENLNSESEQFSSRDLQTLHAALIKAVGVKGIHGFEQGFQDISHQLEALALKSQLSDDFKEALENSKLLEDLDLDFAAQKGYLHAASLSIDDIKLQYDVMFGLNEGDGKTIRHAYLAVIGISIAIILLVLIAALVIFGLTEKGKTKYKNLYLFYFGKPADFEKRWRYSLFMDRQDGKNALIDAVREINAMNVAKEAKRGAYINVYSLYGNTALHMATKRGYPEIVEVLIKNGADRTLLNAQNKTPEQMIPDKYQETEKAGRYEQVEKIYQKYRNKKFRIRVPEVFPSSSFHIFIDDKLDLELVNAFMLQHKSIVTPTLIPTTTHFITKTDSDGACEVDSFETLFWILSGVIIVKDTWITDCLKDPKLINKDSQYLVEKVKFKGSVYSTVTQWTEAMAKSTMPYLHGVYMAVVTPECSNLIHLTAVVNNHGGVVCETFPDKEQFNVGARPYLHSNLGPFFLIHDGKIDLEVYRNDPDKMYTLFTEDEFIHFMLARVITVDTSPDLKQVSNEMED
ncbi:hypothetical protein CAEBREN_28407 [Caenorhabditis brenneri]|uniref:BRCT domain-containing protein n=1 Tax=Caenorhabditis brenneri TaxID=135651 RepID=G0MGM7_CAEBE|nr:hypothetical protein CAEBREN_28407 [Caenorhabditis brenneri]